MKLWKSPILYVGIALVAVVTAALVAPYAMSWGNYRTAIEEYGRKLTGRDVTVAGDISGRLFPWPHMSIGKVRIGNPQGALSADLVTAERVDVRVTLAGLVNGEINIETIDVVRPVISIERMPNGGGSWRIAPTLTPGTSRVLDRVKLDQISLKDGTVHLIDSQRKGRATIEEVNGMLSAPGFAGPWRLRATASYRNRPVEIAVNSGEWRAEEPFRFGFRIAPRDGSGFVYNFDGANDGDEVAGTLRIEPALQADGRSDPEGKFRPLVMTAKVKADFDEIGLDKIEIAPRDDEKSANLLTGSAHVKLGSTIALTADFAANRFDLDAVAGAGVRQMLRDGGGLAVVEGIIDALPENVEARTSLRITSLILGGKPLNGVTLAVDANGDMLRIREVSAGMPGQARGLFKGVIVATEAGPQLSGDLAGEAGDLREFILWSMPELRAPIEHLWTGNRGRFKLQTRIDATAGYLRLQEADFQLDASQGRGGLTLSFGDRPSAEIRIDAPSLDFDPFIPAGLKAFTSSGEGWAELAARLPDFAKARDLRLTLQAGTLTLNGVMAEDVAIDIAANANSVELKTAEIGRVGDARLEATGLVSSGALGPSGMLAAHVLANDPRGLLQLLGLVAPDARPAWFAALGKTDMRVRSDFKPDAQSQNVSLKIEGVSGPLAVKTEVAASGGPAFRDMELSATGTIQSASGASVARLFGFIPVIADESAGSLAVTANGSLASGLTADIKLAAFGANLQYQGTIAGAVDDMSAAGRLGLFAERPDALFEALGIAAADGPVLSVESDLKLDKGEIALGGLQGQFGGAPVSGFLKLAEGRKLSGEVVVGQASLRRLLALAFMPLTGTAGNIEGPFAEGPPGGFTGELWIRPRQLDIFPGLAASESQIGLSATESETHLAIFGKTDDGDVAVEIGASALQGGRKVDGQVSLPVDLAQVLKLADGTAVASGKGDVTVKFAGSGRSPAAMIAGLNGSGTYRFADATLERIDPQRFAEGAKKANSAEALRGALARLVESGSMALGTVQGSIIIVDGRASFLPVAFKSTDADLVLTPLADLADTTLTLSAKLQLKTVGDLPGMEIVYAGQPLAMARIIDNAAIESFLGMRIVEEGIKELERLQAEQKRLLAEEEKARREDEARLQAYLDHRRELRRRVREMQVHRKMQVEAEAAAKIAAEKAAIAAKEEAKRQAEALKEAAERAAAEAKAAEREAAAEATRQTRAEMGKRIRELRVQRRMRAAETKLASEPAERKPRRKAVQDKRVGPVILVPPDPNYRPRKRKPSNIFEWLQDQ